jgi:hypothetical protein
VGDFRLPHRNLQVGCGVGSYRVLWQSQFWGFPKLTDAGGPSPKLSSKLVAGDFLTRESRVAVKKDTQILKNTHLLELAGKLYRVRINI